MDDRYLPPCNGGRWAISRVVDGRWLALIEDSRLERPKDAEVVLRVLGIVPTLRNFERYFPIIEGRGQCPTLELLELFSQLGKEIKKEYGV